MKESIKILREAKRILVEEGWCRDAYARDARGKIVAIDHPNAERFCIIGAINRAYFNFFGKKTNVLKIQKDLDIKKNAFFYLNDNSSNKEAVIFALDRLIEKNI